MVTFCLRLLNLVVLIVLASVLNASSPIKMDTVRSVRQTINWFHIQMLLGIIIIALVKVVL